MTTPNIYAQYGLTAVKGSSSRVINHLCALAREHEGYAKIDNTDGVYMPVVVEILGKAERAMGVFEYVSIAHYGEQNGDLMADPEMTFCLWTPDGESETYAYPCTYRNDYAGYSDKGLELNADYMPDRYNARKMREHVSFVRIWMKNINEQQELNIK